jgi:hypothetical protein
MLPLPRQKLILMLLMLLLPRLRQNKMPQLLLQQLPVEEECLQEQVL